VQVEMRRVDIVTPRVLAEPVLRSVHRAGVLHLAPFDPPAGTGATIFGVEPGGGEDVARLTNRFGAAMTRLTELATLLTLTTASRTLVRAAWEYSDERLLAEIDGLASVSREAADRSADLLRLRGEADRLAGYRRIIEGLQRAIGHLPSIRGYGSTGVVVRSRYRDVIGLIREELETLTKSRCEVVSADIDVDKVAAVLIYPVRQTQEVRSMLGGRDLEDVTLPESFVGVPFDELVPRLDAEEVAIRRRAAGVEAELAGIAAEYGPRIASLRAALGDRLAEVAALAGAGVSDHLAILGGWMPAEEVPALRERLVREVGPEVLVVERPGEVAGRGTPVAYVDRPILRAFEPLVSFVALPRYGTVDPTPVVAFAFPVFVGLMVGDIGYGLILLALAVVARRLWGGRTVMQIVWPIALLAGVSTVLFGILFGEAFGDAGHVLVGLEPLWFDRAEAILPFLILAISIGVAQIAAGLILGVVNATRLRHRREAIGRVALLVGLGAGVVGLASLAEFLPAWSGQAALVALLLSLVAMTGTLGLAGPIEMMGIIGSVLSYARLMAIGLASVMLALIANRMGGLAEDVLIGFAIAAIFHVLAIVLGFFDASVQGLRLQYVEFFSKFVEPGGTRYEPFVSVLDVRGGDRTPARAAGAGGM